MDISAGEAQPRHVAYVMFDIAGQSFGLAVRYVREIIDAQTSVKLPDASPVIDGLIDSQTAAIPIFNLSKRLGLHEVSHDAEGRIIILDLSDQGQRQPIGVRVARVTNVARISHDDIKPVPNFQAPETPMTCVMGAARVNGTLVILLDGAAVFSAVAEPPVSSAKPR